MTEHFTAHLPEVSGIFLNAVLMTITVTLGGGALATLLGMGIAYLSTSKYPFIRLFSATYVALLRAVPTLSLLFFLYYGLPAFDIRLEPIPAAFIAFGLHGAAYVAEIVRAALSSVATGQREAALSIGMTKYQSMWHILYPQAARIALPPYFNYLIQLLKDTSIASVIAVPELMFRVTTLANQIGFTDYLYLYAALIYLILSVGLSRGAKAIERRMQLSLGGRV
ncbi:amino acid ABC transporter permease [Brenneria corticis]|uniref:Amino acid ABC transporter permease n=1 Tax=Brenneria corticis TaxID=2173106 RepID=A0A2U1U4W2_9GAMM|nr:amino acid ABC transporter permease [Brenneria sp. CFCC 11842]PWC16708.1 amino acid ABC transporter permease [Brenneria sp. CFCC 11842]